jgi:hypothetical protein
MESGANEEKPFSYAFDHVSAARGLPGRWR